MLPLSTNIREAYKNGKEDEQNFIQNLALFLCIFLKEHGVLIEQKPELQNSLIEVWLFDLQQLGVIVLPNRCVEYCITVHVHVCVCTHLLP